MTYRGIVLYEPRHEKTGFCLCENKDADELRGNREAVTAKLISAFDFAKRIVQSLYFLNTEFQASSHLLWLYSPVCVGPGRKPRRPVFSERGSYYVADQLIFTFVFVYAKSRFSHDATQFVCCRQGNSNSYPLNMILRRTACD